MTNCNDGEIQRALGRLEGTLGQVEKKQTEMCKELKDFRNDVTKLKIRTYSVNALISAVTGAISGFFSPVAK